MYEQDPLPPAMQFESAAVVKLIQVILYDCQSLYKNNRDFLSLSVD
jgi:hypothetical protein